MPHQELAAASRRRSLLALISRLAAWCLQLLLVAGHLMLRPLTRAIKLPTQANKSVPLGVVSDITRSRTELLLENALLRQQLIVLQRQSKRPQLTNTDRMIMVPLASKLRTWKSALLLVKPDTLLRWHRAGFRLLCRMKSQDTMHIRKPKLSAENIELIQQMARENPLWGAERIRGELLKLDIRIAKRTIQKYMRQMCRAEPTKNKPATQTWSTFVHNHASQIWACDFLQVYESIFRPLFIFFIIELHTRRVVHFRVKRNPRDEWTAQQLREATPYGEQPKYLIRDNDHKFGTAFSRVARASGIKELRIAYKAPKMNAFCERFLGAVRRECLDHLIILGSGHLHGILKEYVPYYNKARPHQGRGQAIPQNPRLQAIEPTPDLPAVAASGKVIAFPVLGGLHHDYRRAA